QPVLVGTVSVDKSEELSARLKRHGVLRNVLNAKHHEREAEIVAQAGQFGAVTISTNMAGRGTDIMLGGNPEFLAKNEMRKQGYPEEVILMATGTVDVADEELRAAREVFHALHERFKEEIAPEAERVRAVGGLYILGTERHESRRIDNQLRGRSGRQGDPGESCFFLSLEDDLMRLFGADKILGLANRLGLPDDQPLAAGLLSNSIENAQKRIEDSHFRRRKHVLTYDDVMNQQRNLIYSQRMQVLNGEDISDTICTMIATSIEETVYALSTTDEGIVLDLEAIEAQYAYLLKGKTLSDFAGKRQKPDGVIDYLTNLAMECYDQRVEMFGREVFSEVERSILLQTVDRHWMDHIDAMDDLKGSIGLQAYAQRDPVNEYRLQGSEMFEEMSAAIRAETVRMVLSVIPREKAAERVQIARPLKEGMAGAEGGESKKTVVIRKAEKVGRNDLCPCGSGKKYKKCCGANKGTN
ncbi:MAG: SEC-C domain-containing protein, partial [Clostridia bacterium]|nr:SEC-C domain-containing protein [Clostridia bacterium]